MNILITNDDGIEAPGLAALVQLAQQFGNPIVFAPSVQQSGSGHQVTVDRPIRVDQLSDTQYSVHGTPADCVRLALKAFHLNFGMLLSGINSGGNLGVDVFMSGTAAAAREGSYFGIPSFAISQYRCKNYLENWEHSKSLAIRGLEFVRHRKPEYEGFWNINLPSLTEVSANAQDVPVRICRVDRNPHSVEYRQNGSEFSYDGNYQARPKSANSDVDLCFSGAVTVSHI